MKFFISHSTRDRLSAIAVKDVLTTFGFDGFLAHEDIVVSEQWRERLLLELESADVLICLLSQYFLESQWCGQEVGIFVADGSRLVIPLRLDKTAPYGFIAHLQGVRASSKIEIETAVLFALAQSHLSIAFSVILSALRKEHDFRRSERLLAPLVPCFDRLAAGQAAELCAVAISHPIVWDAAQNATEYLPQFITRCSHLLDPQRAAVLRYQITKRSLIPQTA